MWGAWAGRRGAVVASELSREMGSLAGGGAGRRCQVVRFVQECPRFLSLAVLSAVLQGSLDSCAGAVGSVFSTKFSGPRLKQSPS